MNTLKALLPCFPSARVKPTIGFPVEKANHYTLLSEKKPNYSTKATNAKLTTEQAACSIITVLQNAKKAGPCLEADIKSLVHQAGGWSEYLAAKILSGLEQVLKAGSQINGALKEAFDKACEAAKAIEGFAVEHPVATAVFCTVISMGVLVILAPYVLEALGFWVGFGELGPIEGKSSPLE